jgi:tetratricopeptide (TPR) repeat protein
MKHGSLAAACVAQLFIAEAVMAIDVAPMWDFGKPELSEQRFRDALDGANADDRLILQTQIARTHGLRNQFDKAQEILMAIKPQLGTASAEARTRHALEWGRTWSSAAHVPESQTPQARDTARAAYLEALQRARAAGLDELAIDAIHMLAFVDTAPEEQLKWGREALAVVEASGQPAAKKWEASIRNNVGYALHQLGRYPQALQQFNQALALREKGSNAQATRTAHWMIAWTLRAMHRDDEALAIQLRLERECAAAGEPDPYVFEELEILYRAKGDSERAAHYAALRKGGTS